MSESKNCSPFSFLSSLEELLHFEMDHQTSACLYGSSLTDDWVAGRSDLDLLVFLPEEKIELLGEKIKIWESNPANPILDGYVIYSSGNVPMVREFYKFDNALRLTEKFIPLIDSWNIKNRSRHLFGTDVKTFVREISQDELRNWAFEHIKDHWIPLLSNGSPKNKIPLSVLILMTSGVARMLMLTKGIICSSKREALKWLADEFIEIRENINQLIKEFEKPDNMAITFTANQAAMLRSFYLHQLHEVKR